MLLASAVAFYVPPLQIEIKPVKVQSNGCYVTAELRNTCDRPLFLFKHPDTVRGSVRVLGKSEPLPPTDGGIDYIIPGAKSLLSIEPHSSTNIPIMCSTVKELKIGEPYQAYVEVIPYLPPMRGTLGTSENRNLRRRMLQDGRPLLMRVRSNLITFVPSSKP